MASINGDWFHSRSSSNLDELLTVRTLVLESQKLEYIGFVWSAGRFENQKMYQFATAGNIQPSTMQTKIRAMIRYGFIKDGNTCPLIWTRMGSLWNDLYSVGNFKGKAEGQVLLFDVLNSFPYRFFLLHPLMHSHAAIPLSAPATTIISFSAIFNKNIYYRPKIGYY